MQRAAVYARISTDHQELKQQVQACLDYCERHRLAVTECYQEVVSGMRVKRPEFERMMIAVRKGQHDAIVIFRLDRLGRNSREVIMLVDELRNRGIDLVSVTENIDTTTVWGRAVRDILIILADLERANISEATKARLAAKRAAGEPLGRPRRASQWQIDKVRRLYFEELQSPERIARQTHLSKGTIYNIVQKKGAYKDLPNYDVKPPKNRPVEKRRLSTTDEGEDHATNTDL